MSCYYPKQALRVHHIRTKSGKPAVRFISDDQAKRLSANPDLMVLPCGQCVGCRLERSRQWAVRCEKEIQTTEQSGGKSCFITLTFSEDALQKRPDPMSLDKRDFQLFMKRLRKRFGKGIRYYHCGEYGEMYRRPHYHAILFNCDFPDKKLWKVINDNRLYVSDILSELWPFGFSTIGDATFDSAAYVARYIMKKQFGKDSWKNYVDYIDEESGEIVGRRLPEYTTMSRRSGIGKEWFDKYLQDVYPNDKIFIRGKMLMSKPPRYYDSLYELSNPSDFALMKQKRLENAKKHSSDSTLGRLIAKQKVLLARIKSLVRKVE